MLSSQLDTICLKRFLSYLKLFNLKLVKYWHLCIFRYMNSPCTRDINRYEDGDFVAHYAEEHSVDKYKELASQLATTDL